MSKSSMSVSSNNIDRFLNFALKKQETESVTPLVYAMHDLDW